MKEKSWKDCLETSSSINISVDKNKITSLIEIADQRIRYLSGIQIKDNNANFIFEGYYSSLLEILHAFILSKGHKIFNHICIGFYLRDILKRKDYFDVFNDCRYIRNASLYYGKKIDIETSIESIQKCNRLMEEIHGLFQVSS